MSIPSRCAQRALVLLLCGYCATAGSQTLRVGLSAEPTSLDPHYHNATPNNQVASHIYEALVESTPDFALRPLLAESFRPLDDTTWEFKLRRNVKFHDGSAFDANDVIFSICRVANVPKSPSSFTIYTKAIADIQTPDPYTLIIKTRGPYPLLPAELMTIGIISDGLIAGERVKFAPEGCKVGAAWPATEDFDNGRNAVGTGPYKLAEYVKGDRIVLKRSERYWGTKPQWETVRLRPVTSSGPRVAALLSGDVDLIENPPIQDIQRLRDSGRFRVVTDVSVRTIYVGMDQRPGTVPSGVTETQGKNPFCDARVRKAMSLALNRAAIVSGVMRGNAKPAEQLLAKPFFGADPALPVLPYDPELAKKLLAEAGYPSGFALTLLAPNDRFTNDAQIAQAIAQMWSRVGVKTRVEAVPNSVFTSMRLSKAGVWLYSWGARTGEMSSSLRALVATPSKEKGWGSSNSGEFSDAQLDGMLGQALATIDNTRRRNLLQQASKRAVETMGAIPVHYEVTPWAMKSALDYRARADQFTLAFAVARATK